MQIMYSCLRILTIDASWIGHYWKGYFDGEPTDEEKEILSVACTEVMADFPVIKRVNE